MSDALWAARMGDALDHTSMMADILGGVLEVAANIAITALATAAVVAATGITVVTGGLGCFLLGAVVGVVVGLAMSKTGADKGLSNLCEGIGNALFPPTVQANILTGSLDTFTNNIPSARAAGAVVSHVAPAGTELEMQAPEEEPEAEASYLDMAGEFFSQMWRPTVASPAPGTETKPEDLVLCMKHPPMPPQFMAEGSDKVTINGQPAVRSGDRSTCDAKVVSSGLISPDVTIGGGSVVVREIRSGKTPGVGLAVTVLLMLKGGKGKFFSKLPCMLAGAAASMAVSSAMGAAANAAMGSSNPVHAATGAKVLGGDDELDFVLPGLLPIDWQRFYNSRDERRNTLFGKGWSVAYEVCVEIRPHPEGGDTLVYTDEQGRPIDMGTIPLGGAVFSAGEGLAVRRNRNGQLLIESDDGAYRLFEPTPTNPSLLRLSQLGDRNDNRIYLDYDEADGLVRLRDTFDLTQVELIRDPLHVTRIERVYPDQRREVLASYDYDAIGNLAEVRDASGQVQRRFAYDTGQRMVEHQLPSGLHCFYEWALIDGLEWRVVKHWTNEGDAYRFDYDLQAGTTRITDSLQRVSTRHWNSQHQITLYSDNLGQTWLFEWNDERQLLNATDPQGGRYEYSYDEAGNLIGETDPLGRSNSTLWLEHWALPLAQTDAAGNSWRYRYDQRGNCTAAIDPLGHVTRYRYDDHGQVVEIIDATGKSKKLRWNPFGQLIEHIDCSGYPTRFSYNEQGFLQVITDALGERTQFHYDAQGRLLSSQLPDGRSEQYQRDISGQLTAYTDPAGHTTRYQHNRRGQVRQRTDAHGRQVEFGYDNFGRLQALVNENGERYRFAWDDGDRLTEQRNLDGSAKRYTYDALDNVNRVETIAAMRTGQQTNEKTIVQHLQRDAMGRLTTRITPDGHSCFRYSPLNQLVEAIAIDNDGNQQRVGFAYDARGYLTEEKSTAGNLKHHYDELGNLIQTQLPDGRRINRLHYGSGHLHQLNLDGHVISDFEHDRLYREVIRTQGHISTRSEYDRSGRLRTRQHRHASLAALMPAPEQIHFEFDPSDHLVGRLERGPQGQQRQLLHYDMTGRIRATQGGRQTQNESFCFDAAANLLDSSSGSTEQVAHNQLITYQDKRYCYDGFGRVIEKSSRRHGLQHFSYDTDHRLIEVRTQKPEGESVVRMRYDPLGRRIEKTEHNSKGQLIGHTRFDWDGLQLLKEHKNSQISLYLYLNNGHEPLARVDGIGEGQRIRYYHNDPNGLPHALTESDGHPLWHAEFQVWGNTVDETREPYFIEEQNLRFQGQYLDRETGLHYNTFRFYDPDIGRFTSPDPLGLTGSLNLYRYAPNPFTWIDPLGLKEDEIIRYMGKSETVASKAANGGKGGLVPNIRGEKAIWVNHDSNPGFNPGKEQYRVVATVNNEGVSMLNNHKDISDVDYKETGLKDGVLSKTNEPKAKGIGNRLLDKFNKTITSFRVEKKGPNGKWKTCG
ncbi:RHS repeat-associated core domain-containing protein [Pseudomonas sp. W22_MBD1_FP4]|uniref:RHS repeat-associated core domain-containing protein n=1 Tax=Pseudomonas sp. W22_MBD1_FP4 TaxID=3240272 RepID=UPI003F979585